MKTAQFRTLFYKLSTIAIILTICAFRGVAQIPDTAKIVIIPLRVANELEGSYQRDSLKTILIDSLTKDKQDLKAIIKNDSSIHVADSLNRNTLRGELKAQSNDKVMLRDLVKVERKRARRNGVERDIGIGLILLLTFVIVKP